MIIYKITNLQNNKVYIGQTKQELSARWGQHLANARRGVQLPLYEDIRRVGATQFSVDILDTANTEAELNDKEIHYISEYNATNPACGYNILSGGATNPMQSSYVRAKHQVAMQSDPVRVKISDTMKIYRRDNKFSISTRQKISKKLQGNTHNKGKTRPVSATTKTAIAHYKQVSCYNLENNTVHKFCSVKDAANWWNCTFFDSCYNTTTLMNRIRKSAINHCFINNLLWKYE